MYAIRSYYVQLSRGCPFNCDFCDIIVMFGRKPRYKAPAQIERKVAGREITAVAEDRITSYNVCYTKLLRGAVEAMVRMVQQDIASADLGEYLCGVIGVKQTQAGVGYGLMGWIAQFWISLHLEAHQICQTQEALS